MIRISKLGRAAAALVVGGSLVATALPAEAGWRNGYGGNGGYGGYRGYAPAYGGGYGYRHGGYPAYGYGYGYKRRNNNAGVAIAAGVIGALALGAIASQAQAAPAYGYGYRQPCRMESRQVYDQWGYPRWQQVRVCY